MKPHLFFRVGYWFAMFPARPHCWTMAATPGLAYKALMARRIVL